ncbi:MAG: hypothetical protein ACI4HI_01020 [Lachnospiraceae bacterium]
MRNVFTRKRDDDMLEDQTKRSSQMKTKRPRKKWSKEQKKTIAIVLLALSTFSLAVTDDSEENKQLTAQVTELTTQNQNLKTKQADLQKELIKLQETDTDEMAQAEELQEKVDELSEKYESEKKTTTELKSKNKKLKTKIDKLNASYDNLNTQYASLQASNEQLQQQADAVVRAAAAPAADSGGNETETAAAGDSGGNETAEATPTAAEVYVTNTGEKYHRAGCSYLRQSQIPISKDDAIAQGYTPCSRCNP